MPSQGSNTLYVHVYDGGLWGVSNSFIVFRDDSVSPPTIVSYTPNPVGPTRQYSVTFNAPDTYSTNANEMGWELRTASGGGGTLIASGTFTQGNGISTGTVTDLALVDGSNTRWLRIRDGAWNWAETSFTVQAALLIPDAGNEAFQVIRKLRRRDEKHREFITRNAGRELEIIVEHASAEAEAAEASGAALDPLIEAQVVATIAGQIAPSSAEALDPAVQGQHVVLVSGEFASAQGAALGETLPHSVAYGWRWRKDDGDADSATWYAAQEVQISESPGVVIRLRYGYGIPGSSEMQASEPHIPQFRLQGDTDWKDVEEP